VGVDTRLGSTARASLGSAMIIDEGCKITTLEFKVLKLRNTCQHNTIEA